MIKHFNKQLAAVHLHLSLILDIQASYKTWFYPDVLVR